HDAVTGDVLFQRVGMISLTVTFDVIARCVFVVQTRALKYAGACGVDARADDFARFDQIGVSVNVRRRRLRIARRRHAVGQIGHVLPDLRLMNVARRPHVGVNVNEARNDCLAGHVDHFGAGGEDGLTSAGRLDLGDAVIGDDDVALLYHLVAFHRDDSGAGKYDHSFRLRAGRFDRDVEAFRPVGADGLAIELRAPRPGHRFAVARPRDVIAAFSRHLLYGN